VKILCDNCKKIVPVNPLSIKEVIEKYMNYFDIFDFRSPINKTDEENYPITPCRACGPDGGPIQ
jgi:hypothetical protein